MKILFRFLLSLCTVATFALVALVFAQLAFAQDLGLPDGDPVAQILVLIRDYKVLGPLGLGMAVVVLIAELVKKFVGDGMKYKRLLVTALACIYGTLLSIKSGLGVPDAIMAALITGGGASALYEGLKGLGWIKSSNSSPSG